MRALQDPALQAPMQFCYYVCYLCHENVWRRNSSSPFRDAFIDVDSNFGIPPSPVISHVSVGFMSPLTRRVVRSSQLHTCGVHGVRC